MTQGEAKFPSVNPDSIPILKQFYLHRFEDATGTSGCGVVAIGVMFPSGLCVLEWTTLVKSIGYYNSIADVEAIHGHNGKTKIEWIDKKSYL